MALSKEQLEALKPGCTKLPEIPAGMFLPMSRRDAQTIAKGLLPDGLDVSALTPQGRQELREAIELILSKEPAR